MAGLEGARRSTIKWAAATIALFTVSCVGGLYYLLHQPKAASLTNAGFDFSRVDAPPPPPPPPPAETPAEAPKPNWMPAESPAPIVPRGLTAGRGGPKTKSSPAGEAARRELEKKWLEANGSALRRYAGRLNALTARYYKTSPVVREVDAAFAAMPRYMDVRRRHNGDGDPFAFAREAIALPEVRAEIARRMAEPKVWGVAMQMMCDALRDPPPKEVYEAAKKFMVDDPVVVDYIPEAIGDVNKNIGAAIQGIPPGLDVSPVFKVAKDVAPEAMAGASPPAAGARR